MTIPNVPQSAEQLISNTTQKGVGYREPGVAREGHEQLDLCSPHITLLTLTGHQSVQLLC